MRVRRDRRGSLDGMFTLALGIMAEFVYVGLILAASAALCLVISLFYAR